MHSRNIAYLPAVDELRGLAAAWVVCYHALHLFSHQFIHGRPFAGENWLWTDSPLLAWLVEGHSAVALFMVLSGFIFTHGALGRGMRIGDFYLNRFLRIYPLLLALILLAGAAQPAAFSFSGAIQTVLLGANLPGALTIPPYTSLFWTIAVEFQFYLLFPFLIAALERGGPRFLALLILTALVLRLLAVELGGSARDISYYTLLGRLDQFAVGMAVGYFFHAGRLRLPGVAWPTFLLGMALLLFGFHRAGGWPLDTGWKVLWPTLEGAGWGLFLLAYLAWAGRPPRRGRRLLGWVGERSYSLYLTHLMVLYLLLHWQIPMQPFPGHPVWNALANALFLALPSAIALATLTYAGIERPFLAMRRKYIAENAT